MARKLPEIDPFETLPARYEDRTAPAPVSAFKDGQRVFVRGTVKAVQGTPAVTVITMEGNGGQFLVKYFTLPPYLAAAYTPEHTISFMGTPKQELTGWCFYHPDIIHYDEQGRVFPIYNTPKGIGEKRFREHVWSTTRNLIAAIKDEISTETLTKRGLPTIAQALASIHMPLHHRADLDEKALLRLAYREIYQVKQRLMAVPRHSGPVISIDPEPYINSLPFKLTDDQKKAIREIARDMASGKAMRRLLLGDVNTGKTEVAIAAAYMAHQANYRTVLLAPTTVLAKQLHDKCVSRLGTQAVSTYTGKDKSNPAWIIVGTQALLFRQFAGVGLIIIDETHKTGVRQRQTLLGDVHAMQMTATPIPRTVGLIFHGAVDISALYQSPFPRNVATMVVGKEAKGRIIGHIRAAISKKDKALIIYPYVSEARGDYQAVEEKVDIWEKLFPGQCLCVHGKLEDKVDIIRSFRQSREHNILVATSLIENGLDIPEATILVVAGAEKFGISQLHQLRGRIGRRGAHSTCYFISYNEESARRLKPLETIQSGFEIAEIDGEQRGFGDIFGYAQSGYSYKLPQTKLYKTVSQWITEDIFNELQTKHKEETKCTTK